MASKEHPQNIELAFSAGGVTVDNGKYLLIKTQNLKGEMVWTFPKGHIEKGESAEQAAVREVREETGYSCKIKRGIGTVKYWFRFSGKTIKKTVKWYLMEPLKREGTFDEEVIEVKWIPAEELDKILTYDSDRELIKKIEGKT